MAQTTLSALDRIAIQRASQGQPEGSQEFHTLGALGITPQTDNGDVGTTAGLSRSSSQGQKMETSPLVNVPIVPTAVTTSIGVGAVKIFDFPRGFIGRVSCRASLAISIPDTAERAKVLDATPEGDLGVGTVAPADQDALGVDATDDDWATAAPFTMAAYASPAVALATEAAGVHDGSVTPIDLFVTAQIDAADINDGQSVTCVLNGTVWFTWQPQSM